VIKLAAFDLDGTLVRDGTCVQSIAQAIGREEECASFERLNMRDMPAVAGAREAMAEWYRPYTFEELTAGLADLGLAPGAEEGFALLREHGVVTAIVSITWRFAVEWYARRLGADYAHGTGLLDGHVEHVWPTDKGRWLRDLAAQLDVPHPSVAAVGDSEGDRELLEAAGIRYYVGTGKIEVSSIIHIPHASILDVAQRLVDEP
jgi:HAD superfamily phosphoserine phosphatase-like hydrolase